MANASRSKDAMLSIPILHSVRRSTCYASICWRLKPSGRRSIATVAGLASAQAAITFNRKPVTHVGCIW